MSDGTTTWNFTYNADGIRTKRTNGSTTYSYVYNGDKLSQMTVGSNLLQFSYDAAGTPMAVLFNGTTYYYATNLQGDVIAILDATGAAVVEYTYDAWGNLLATTGSMAATLGTVNPLRYRGYVYDQEYGFYYLSTRYYNPEVGRFLNADGIDYLGINGELTSNNLFAYCINNPVNHDDEHGTFVITSAFLGAVIGGAIAGAIIGASSYLISSRLNNTEITAGGLLGATGVGAIVGGIGGAAGVVAKGVLSTVAGAISGIYAGASFDGSIMQKIGIGVLVGAISGVATFAGASINTTASTFAGNVFTNYVTTLTVGVPAEIAAVSVQQAEKKYTKRSTQKAKTSRYTTSTPKSTAQCINPYATPWAVYMP